MIKVTRQIDVYVVTETISDGLRSDMDDGNKV